MRNLLIIVALFTATSVLAKPTRNEQVHADKKALGEDEVWIYNDLERGRAEARAQNKPLLVVYRCIP